MPRTLLLATLITILSGPAYAETPSHRDQLLTEAIDRAAQQQELDDDPLSPTWMQPRSPTKDSADYFWGASSEADAGTPSLCPWPNSS